MVQDVGQAILESYSRVIESLAFNVLARIDDVIYIDEATKQHASAQSNYLFDEDKLGGAVPIQRQKLNVALL